MVDEADAAVSDEAPGDLDGGHATVVEVDDGVLSAGFGRLEGGEHPLGLGDGVGDGLLDDHVFAGLEGRNGDLGVHVAGGADVNDVDVVALDDLPPGRWHSRPSRIGRPAAATCSELRPTSTACSTAGTSK